MINKYNTNGIYLKEENDDARSRRAYIYNRIDSK
jgi:hypothetical protein